MRHVFDLYSTLEHSFGSQWSRCVEHSLKDKQAFTQDMVPEQTQALPGTFGDPCHSFILIYSFLTLMVVPWLYKTVSLFWENIWKYSGLECLEVSNLLLNGVGKIETLIKQMEHNAILLLYFCSFSLGLKRDWSGWVGWAWDESVSQALPGLLELYEAPIPPSADGACLGWEVWSLSTHFPIFNTNNGHFLNIGWRSLCKQQ